MSVGGTSSPRPADHAPSAPLVDALVVDRYLDALLSAERDDDPGVPELDPSVGRAIRRLRRDLGRVHPSFRFEERLAVRLADEAARMRLRAAAGGEGALIPLVASPPEGESGEPVDAASDALPLAGSRPSRTVGLPAFRPTLPDRSAVIASLPRPLLIGGALTSAAISLAGAYVALRGRPSQKPGSPMARAARAAHHARAASSTLGAGAVAALRPAARAVMSGSRDAAESRLD